MTVCLVVGEGDVAQVVLRAVEEGHDLRVLIARDDGLNGYLRPAFDSVAPTIDSVIDGINSINNDELIACLTFIGRFDGMHQPIGNLATLTTGTVRGGATRDDVVNHLVTQLEGLEFNIQPASAVFDWLGPVTKLPIGHSCPDASRAFSKAREHLDNWQEDTWATACIASPDEILLTVNDHSLTNDFLARAENTLPYAIRKEAYLCRYSPWATLPLRIPSFGLETVQLCGNIGLKGILGKMGGVQIFNREEAYDCARNRRVHIEYFD